MIRKFLSIIFILFFFNSCGFTPMLKNLKNQNDIYVYHEIDPSSSYQAKQILSSMLETLEKNEARFVNKVNIIETESAVNIDSNGSVNEYKIDVLIKFKIFNIKTNNLVFESQTRGFANYDVSNSEYTNTLVKKDALEQALANGFQLMNIIVQSKVN